MSTTARDFLAAFDALPAEVRHEVATELLRRTGEYGALTDAALDGLAADLFRSYDAEEAGRADS